jgi:kynureninase
MGPVFEPAEGIRRFQIATPPVIGLRAVQVAHRMIAEAGMAAISAKAQRGTSLMIDLYDAWLAPLGFSLLTPRDPDQRGGHITIAHADAKQIAAAMRTLTKTIPDYREPNGIRLAISPLPTSYTEVWDGFDRLRELVASGTYRGVAAAGRVT